MGWYVFLVPGHCSDFTVEDPVVFCGNQERAIISTDQKRFGSPFESALYYRTSSSACFSIFQIIFITFFNFKITEPVLSVILT